MSQSEHRQRLEARGRLFDAIIDAIMSAVQPMNYLCVEEDKVTLTSPLRLREFFDVYRQPEGAPKAQRLRVSWAGDAIKLERLDGSYSEIFEVPQAPNGVFLQELVGKVIAHIA